MTKRGGLHSRLGCLSGRRCRPKRSQGKHSNEIQGMVGRHSRRTVVSTAALRACAKVTHPTPTRVAITLARTRPPSPRTWSQSPTQRPQAPRRTTPNGLDHVRGSCLAALLLARLSLRSHSWRPPFEADWSAMTSNVEASRLTDTRAQESTSARSLCFTLCAPTRQQTARVV